MDVKKNLDALIPKAPTPGELRPGVKEDNARRQTGTDLMRGQAAQGQIPQPGEKPIAQQPRPAGMPATPPATPPKQPAISDQSPTVGLPNVVGHETGDAHSAGTLQPRVSPNSPEMEKAVRAGKEAFNALQNLAGGGVKKNIQNLPNLPTAVVTSKEAFQKALAARLPGTKSTAQSKLTDTAAKTEASPRTPQEGVTPEAVAAKVKAEAQGTQTGDAGEAAAKAQLIAQKVPSPLLSEIGARREENRDKVATDGPTAKALANVVTGRGISGIATAQEFSAGGNGGFGDPNGESSGLAHKVGTVPQIHVYGDTQDYPETELLYAKLGLSTVLYGAQELAQRAVPVGERIANTQDDTPLSLRVLGSATDHKQMAEGGRGSAYGLGKIFG